MMSDSIRETHPSRPSVVGAMTAIRLPISAIILTFNEEANVGRCLESINGWCEEIHVVDSGSTDATLEICAAYGAQMQHHPFVDSASQWEWALANVPVRSPWIFVLDADHQVTRELWEEIMEVLSNPNSQINGYYSRHQYFFWGKPMHGFKPYGLRLFKKGRVTMDRSELVDMRFVVDGKTGVLRKYVYEHNMKEWSIDFWIDKHQKFARKLATEEILRHRGRLRWKVTASLIGNPDQRVIWLKNTWYNSPLYVRSIFYFAYRYFIRLGFLDG